MSGRTTALAVFVAAIMMTQLGAQQPEEPSTKLRKLGLSENSGSVPVFYVPSAKERAIRFQISLDAARSWYEKQLRVRVSMILAVLDAEMWERVSNNGYPTPHNLPGRGGPGLVLIAERGPAAATRVAGADPEHAPGGVLQGEHTLFHEAGHLFADALNIRSGNPFINELIPGVFMAAYISAERPDLEWLLEDRRSRQPPPPRYTSLADLDYLYGGVGQSNYVWFQGRLEALADFLAKGQSFPAVIEKLRTAFPADSQKQETLTEIDARLEGVRSGFLKVAGPLAGPPTITRIAQSACGQPAANGISSRFPLVVHNSSSDPLVVDTPEGRKVTVSTKSWRTFSVSAGVSLKLPAGVCLVGRDEPTLAVIEK